MTTAKVRRARGSVLMGILLLGCVALLAGNVAWRVALATIDARLEQSLILTLRALETEIDRFRYLPQVAGEDARITAAIRSPHDPVGIAAANRYLSTVADLAEASHLYLMDSTGMTRAASNWAEEDSFVKNDYSFRPYFQQAITYGAGAFYAIGVTTGLPGYFLAAKIIAGAKAGVVVVKIDLTALEKAWIAADLATAVLDPDGVVFLSGKPEWMYRPLTSLAPDVVARIEKDRTYAQVDLTAAIPLQTGNGVSVNWIADAQAGRMRAQIATFSEGWRVIAAEPVRPAFIAALGWGVGVALICGLGIGLGKIQRQRQQLVALRLRQSNLLERKVAERTERLALEIEARRQTEAELRAAQETLIHSEKMAALGRMSAAIVHEISQPLAAMEASLAAAEMSLTASPSKTATRIETARNLIKRMQRTTKHLKSFSRKETGVREAIDVTSVINSALDLVQPRAKAVAVVPQFTPPRTAARVQAGRVRLEQVLVNLLLNAMDAVEGQSDPQIEVIITEANGALRIAVSDTGSGIAPENIERVTEPFFSTKTKSEGLGLGLAISQAILAEFGGRFEISSQRGEGTTMTVILPCFQEDAA
jgi:two-component system C4-dicarboxylate transport sensor histidine kinase DctB